MTDSRRVPLSVLDLSPFASGEGPADGIRHTIDLARQTERAGYRRYWLAEHHANPGISGSQPHVIAALVASATSTIRVGTAATIAGNYEPIQIAEAAGIIGAASGGRFDLGFGRSGSKAGDARGGWESLLAAAAAAPRESRVVDGLVIPPPRLPRADLSRFAVNARLLGRTDGDGERFEQTVDDVLAFLRGDYAADVIAPDGGNERVAVVATPAHDHGGVQVWVHGSTPGESARIAGERGLPFGSNYHVAPTFVLEAIAAYRAAFRPSAELAEPYVIVSADVVVGETDASAAELAAGYAPWVLSIRSGAGAIAYPSPEEARAHVWTDEERGLVQDRLDTQFVGSPEAVVAKLETLQRVTGADELLITTVTHDHADRVRSYELLAEAWAKPHGAAADEDTADARTELDAVR